MCFHLLFLVFCGETPWATQSLSALPGGSEEVLWVGCLECMFLLEEAELAILLLFFLSISV